MANVRLPCPCRDMRWLHSSERQISSAHHWKARIRFLLVFTYESKQNVQKHPSLVSDF